MFAIGSNLLQNLTNPNKTGWLNKVGAVRKSVKRRWFVLKDFTVAYFTSREVRVTFDKTGLPINDCFSKLACLVPFLSKEVSLKSPIRLHSRSILYVLDFIHFNLLADTFRPRLDACGY